MSDEPGSSADEPGESRATGGFRDQYITYVNTGREGLLESPAAPPRQVAEQQLLRLQRRFTRPSGINDAYDTLERNNIVFLDGTRGSGRTTAARVLLRELPRGTGRYHEISTVARGKSPEILTPDLVEEEDRMLLDLSPVNETLWKQYHDRLLGFHKTLVDKRAFLAVVLPHQYADQLSADFIEYRKTVDRPDGLEVLIAHLRVHGVAIRRPRPTSQVLSDYLGISPPMRELARLADLILEAREALRGDGSFTDWCELAIAARTARAEEVDSFVPELRKGSQRALLLTVAMLHGAPADAIHRATVLLQEILGIPSDTRPLLEHKGLAERLRKVGAARDTSACVHFEKLRYDHAVRRHFWLNMPDLRQPLRSWVNRVLSLPELPAADHERLVVRFAELCLTTNGVADLLDTAWYWAGKSDGRSTYLQAAAELLRWGVRNEEVSLGFRVQIYRWSLRTMADGPRRVLIEVCLKVMSVYYPEQAVVRLHHLARGEPPGRRPARDALLGFVAQDPGLLRYLLYRLVVFPSTRPGHREFDVRLFLDLTTVPARPPHAFLRGPSTRGWLTVCWTDVFQHAKNKTWRPYLERWITAADTADDPAIIRHALDVLIAAAADDYPALSQIYLTARTSLSVDKTERLLSAISEVQRARMSQRNKPQEAPS